MPGQIRRMRPAPDRSRCRASTAGPRASHGPALSMTSSAPARRSSRAHLGSQDAPNLGVRASPLRRRTRRSCSRLGQVHHQDTVGQVGLAGLEQERDHQQDIGALGQSPGPPSSGRGCGGGAVPSKRRRCARVRKDETPQGGPVQGPASSTRPGPKARPISATVGCPGAVRACATASASMTWTPKAANRSATVDFPLPIPPVRATRNTFPAPSPQPSPAQLT